MDPAPTRAEPALMPKASRLRWQIGSLIVLALVLAGTLLFAIASKQGMFGSHVTMYFVAEDVTGLAPGTTVRLSGFRVGKIQTLELQDDHTVRVTLAVDEGIFGRLRSDARAVVVREQLKPAAIDLRPGKAEKPLSRDDPRLAYQRRGTLTEIADDLRQRLAPILDDVRALTAVARERRHDMDAILQHTNTMSAALAATSQQMQGLSTEIRERARGLGAQSEVAMVQANKSLVRLDGLIGQAERGLGAVNARLPGMLEKGDKSLAQLDEVLRNTRTITAAAAAGLPPLMRSAPPLVDESREMLQGLRESWPLRTMLPAPPPALLPIDSHDAGSAREPGAR